MIQTNYSTEPLDPSVIDYGTVYHHHNVYTHLGCVLLRCLVGGALILSQTHANKQLQQGWIVFCIVIVIIFTIKYLKYSASDRVVWKVYLRTIITYTMASTLIYNDKYDYAGLLVMVDALMGLQSRHMAFISSYIQTKKLAY